MKTKPSSYPTDADAARAAEIAYWSGRKLAFENAAASAARMHRLATIENPQVREHCTHAAFADLHDKFHAEFVDEIGDFRETPFGLAEGEGGNDALTRAVKRREFEAEKRRESEDESYRRMLETKSILGTQAEKEQAFEELAKLDNNGIGLSDIEA